MWVVPCMRDAVRSPKPRGVKIVILSTFCFVSLSVSLTWSPASACMRARIRACAGVIITHPFSMRIHGTFSGRGFLLMGMK